MRLRTAALALILAGCATPQPIYTCAAPEALLVPHEVPPLAGDTNRDVGVYAIEVRAGWQACEADRAAIRESLRPPD